jgi:hypothetical protein
MTPTEALDEIDRIHDDEPHTAATGLRELDADALPADKLPLLAFLCNHVLGEKLGLWSEAASRLEQLRASRADAPLAVTAHAATAAYLDGRATSPALASLSQTGGAAEAGALVALNALGLRPPADIEALAAQLERLAQASQTFEDNGPLNQRLAIAFNNGTSRLLDLAKAPVVPAVAAALLAGSAASLRFWQAAGTWVHLERALYLRALVHNRIGVAAAAREECVRALDVIAANGDEPIDRVFLQLQLAGALLRLGDTAAGKRQLAEARAAAAQWDDAGLKSWFNEEHDRLFGAAEGQA